MWFELLLIAAFLTPSLVLMALMNPQLFRDSPARRTVVVLVLGDIGRSPRMMYHAESFAKLGWETYLVGYAGSDLLPSLLASPHVHVKYIAQLPSFLKALPFLLLAPIKVAFQVLGVLHALWYTPDIGAEYLLVQNPPSIPTLALAQLIAYLRGAKLIVDWHNLGCSILALRTGERSVLYRIARWFERTFGKSAHAHLFVTEAMKDELSSSWQLEGQKVVLRDRPPPHFRRSGPMTQHELFARLIPKITPALPASFSESAAASPTSTLLTRYDTSRELVESRPDRPAVLVSSTSWTADEDFSVLLHALDGYQAEAAKARTQSTTSDDAHLPRLLVLISGKGPLRASFEREVAGRESSGRWTDVTARCVWLDVEDYPKFLGSANLGISLHQSSSGLDLPMKVVDMFGCGVPVLARNFNCIDELVAEGRSGLVFDTSEELAEQLQHLLAGFPSSSKALQDLRDFFPESHTPDSPGNHSDSRSSSRSRPRSSAPASSSKPSSSAATSFAKKMEVRRRGKRQQLLQQQREKREGTGEDDEEHPALQVIWETWDKSWRRVFVQDSSGQAGILGSGISQDGGAGAERPSLRGKKGRAR